MKFRLKRRNKQAVAEIPDPSGFKWYHCQNCGYSFEGNYCPSCGQSTKEVKQSLGYFIKDFAGSLFALDLKVLRSIPVLLFQPGRLSKAFIDGKRQRYAAPFRLFFFASIILFFLIGWQTRILLNDTPLTDAATKIIYNSESDSLEVGEYIGNVTTLGFLRDIIDTEISDTTISQEEREEREKNLGPLREPNYLISSIYKYVSWSFFLHEYFSGRRKRADFGARGYHTIC